VPAELAVDDVHSDAHRCRVPTADSPAGRRPRAVGCLAQTVCIAVPLDAMNKEKRSFLRLPVVSLSAEYLVMGT
jgi:hypothetical protein